MKSFSKFFTNKAQALVLLTLLLLSSPKTFGMPYFLMPTKQTIVMLCPAGDAHDPGRKLKEGYERGQAFKFAEQLQAKLSEFYGLRVFISRKLGQAMTPLQTALFANRLHVDFFLKIHLYKEQTAKPKLDVYQHVYNPLTDFTHQKFSSCDFIPLHLAHTINIHTSKMMGSKMVETLAGEQYSKKFDCQGLHGVPLVPLVGITAPALLLEIGINRDDKWHSLINAVSQSLGFLMDS